MVPQNTLQKLIKCQYLKKAPSTDRSLASWAPLRLLFSAVSWFFGEIQSALLYWLIRWLRVYTLMKHTFTLFFELNSFERFVLMNFTRWWFIWYFKRRNLLYFSLWLFYREGLRLEPLYIFLKGIPRSLRRMVFLFVCCFLFYLKIRVNMTQLWRSHMFYRPTHVCYQEGFITQR